MNKVTRRKHPAATQAEAEKPPHFFQKQLAQEEALSWSTAGRLYSLAAEVLALAPWNFLADSEIFLLRDAESNQMCYCSVMGALGEVFSLFAYVGAESYRFFRFLQSGGKFTSTGQFLAVQRGVSVEFVRLAELTPSDRELLKCFGHSFKKGSLTPIFRALRPGFHPWYITEPEGRTIAACMEALVAFCTSFLKNNDFSFWEQEDVYPLLTPMDDCGERKYTLEMVTAPEPSPVAPQLPTLDEPRMRKVRDQDYAVRGSFEADTFYPPGAVGGKNERKACICIGLVAEANSGFLFHPEVASSVQPAGEVLANSILNAIDVAHFLPAEVRVSGEEFKTLLTPLGQQLGIPIHVAKSLPSLERARESLLSMMFGQ